MPLLQKDARDFVRQRSPEWVEHQRGWRWLADSYEGGDRYRYANYATDPTTDHLQHGSSAWQGLGFHNRTGTAYGTQLDCNLIPHTSELMDRTDEANWRGGWFNDLYEMRRARTPIPKTMERVIRRHLSRIFAREVTRQGPALVKSWWEDVDGLGTPIDKAMRKTVGPLLLTYGQIDLCFDRPPLDDALPVQTRADQQAAGLDRVILSYILPENMLWWKLDRRQQYFECLVFERDDAGNPLFRHWTATESTAYDKEGLIVGLPIEHGYGRVPIVRIFDERKLRCTNVGQPRYESVAEAQKAIYNVKSEIVLSNIQQAHAIIQVPEDLIDDSGQIQVGPGGALKKKRSQDGSTYTGSDYLVPPKDATQFLRQTNIDTMDEADRDAALTKPAGATATGTVAQSGISKSFDSQEGNDYLSEVSETLAGAERSMAAMLIVVATDGRQDIADYPDIDVEYPKEFDLASTADIATAWQDLQTCLGAIDGCPKIQFEVGVRLIRKMLPGLSDDKYRDLEGDLQDWIDQRIDKQDQMAEAGVLGIGSINPNGPNAGDGIDGDQETQQALRPQDAA